MRRDAEGMKNPETLELPRVRINYTFCVGVTSLILGTVVSVVFLVVEVSRLSFILFVVPTILAFVLGCAFLFILLAINMLSLLLNGDTLFEQLADERKNTKPNSSTHSWTIARQGSDTSQV